MCKGSKLGGTEIMKLVSVNVGLPREAIWKGRTVTTGIFKEPIESRVIVRRLNLEGDRQADLSVHGGPDKAVYAYPVEHIREWSAELGQEVGPASFGENLTTEGALEDGVCVGDVWACGDARLHVYLPPQPTFNLATPRQGPAL